MANTLYANGYAIWGLKGGRQLAKGLSFFVEGRNLGNKNMSRPPAWLRTPQGWIRRNSFPVMAARSMPDSSGACSSAMIKT